MNKLQLYIIIGLLVFLGLGGMIYKSAVLGFPVSPGEKQRVWNVEARITFDAQAEPAKVSFAVPGNLPGMTILDEDFSALGYGFLGADEMANEGLHRRVLWSRRLAEGKQTLFYKVTVLESGHAAEILDPREKITVPEPFIEESLEPVVQTVINHAKQRSADNATFTSELLTMVNAKEPSEEIAQLFGKRTSRIAKARVVVDILRSAGIPAGIVRGLKLDTGSRRQPLMSLVAVLNKGAWVLFDPHGAQPGLPDSFLVWQRGGPSLIDVEGGKNATVTFSAISDIRSAKDVAQNNPLNADEFLVDFSIYTLPIEQQNAFKILLMIPIGALIVVLMRNIVGISTSGTFMPILLALAFMQTQLLPGITIFIVIVSIGLLVRSYLSRLNLLLVPRISAVVVVVITIMAVVSVISHKLGIHEGLSITLFPMIILSWTIERLSVLWEEQGPREVLTQSGGSLFVATLTYIAMKSFYVSYLIFTFPTLLLVVLAIILGVGNYTGYRLSELRRFEPLINKEGDA